MPSRARLPAPQPGALWYGIDAGWWVPLERDARRVYGQQLRWLPGPGHVEYRVTTRIDGDSSDHDLEIHFYADPSYATFGLTSEEYPRVFGDRGLESPHRMPDGALCLWQPLDPPDRRWVPADGLLALIEHACRHLFCESWWRETDEWLLDQAPHGLPRRGAITGSGGRLG